MATPEEIMAAGVWERMAEALERQSRHLAGISRAQERSAAALEDQARAHWAQAYAMTFAIPDGEWSAASGAMLHGICSEAINKLANGAAHGGDADG